MSDTTNPNKLEIVKLERLYKKLYKRKKDKHLWNQSSYIDIKRLKVYQSQIMLHLTKYEMGMLVNALHHDNESPFTIDEIYNGVKNYDSARKAFKNLAEKLEINFLFKKIGVAPATYTWNRKRFLKNYPLRLPEDFVREHWRE